MPSDIVGGTTGDVTASGFNCDIDGWSFDAQIDEAMWRTFASKWKKRANVAYAATGEFTGTIQFNDTNTAPMPKSTGGTINDAAFEGVSLTLTADTGCTLTGTANIVGVGLRRVATDRMTGTFRFAFTGQPSETWDETA